MGISFSKLFSNLFSSLKDVRIAMLGLDAAGKTTILYKLKLGEVVTTIPTIGFNVETVEYKSLNMTVWDVGGQERLRPLWRHYYSNCAAVIFVVDSSDIERVKEAQEEVHRMMQEDELKDATLLVFANKMDMPRVYSAAELAEKLNLGGIKQQWHVQPTCATTGVGLYEGLDWLCEALKNKKRS